jgi:hypothetical protein
MSKPREWRAEVAAWRASGKSAREFGEERGYPATRLYWWSSQIKRQEGAGEHGAAVPIARVIRRDSASSRSRSTPVVIQVGSARVEVSADADRDALSVALQALARMSWEVQS